MKKINIKALLLIIPFLVTLPLFTQSVNDDFLDGIPDDLKKEIEELNLDELTPIEALLKLNELKRKINK